VNLTRANIAADPARCALAPGCAPANFVGAGSLSPDALRLFLDTETDRLRFHLRDFGLSASGPLLELPAGLAQVALGGKLRDEDGFFQTRLDPPQGRQREHRRDLETRGAARHDRAHPDRWQRLRVGYRYPMPVLGDVGLR
jgi:hypothetical protein